MSAGVDFVCDCPRCKGALKEVGLGLRCASCSGVFVPRDVLERFLESLPVDDGRDGYRTASLPEAERTPPKPRGVWEPDVRYLMCPVCGTPMSRANFARRSGVLTDVCPRHGTWFDHGEAETAARWVSQLSVAESEEQARIGPSATSERPLLRDQLLSLLFG